MPFSPNRHIPDADGGQGYIPKIPLPDETIYAPKKPIKFPFEDRDIPGPPEGMTIPPRQPLPIQQPPPEKPPWLGRILPIPPQNELEERMMDIPTRPSSPSEPRWDFQEPYEAPPEPEPYNESLELLDGIPREEIDKFPPKTQEQFKQLFPNKWKFGEAEKFKLSEYGNQPPPIS
tara:strand:+ start:1577 stop:2101 length:525 start_codon:yes stop_codon:yes gene_type:complete